MSEHWLKVWPQYFDALLSERKSFEFRRDDRLPRYEAGDVLVLGEYDPKAAGKEYTGRRCARRVTYVARGGVIPDGYCCMAIVPTNYPVAVSEPREPEVDRE